MNILVFNAGSSSLKARLIDPASGKTLVEKKVERIAEGQLEAAVGSVLAEVKGVAIAAVATVAAAFAKPWPTARVQVSAAAFADA